jgi:hypothetical protein
LNLYLIFLPVVAFLLFPSIIDTSYSDDFLVLGNGHAKIYVSNQTSGNFDFTNDELTDYYVKAHFTGNANQLYKVDIKIEDSCVDGDTYEDAKMKIGFSDVGFPIIWHTDGFEAWTPWFKSGRSTDLNKQIDLVVVSNPPQFNVPVPFPSSGDDVIQKNPKDKVGSFVHKASIEELDGQAGWEGSIHFNAPSGTYLMWSILPGDGTEGCETQIGVTIPITIV